MRSQIAALAALTCLSTAGLAQAPTKDVETNPPRASASGEEAAPKVDPAILDRCRQQAAEQKLTDGPARTAFMGTCVTPED